jgi:charged multivesicular body protein 6
MGGGSSKKKKPQEQQQQHQISDKDRAILELKRQRVKLTQYQQKVQAVLRREHVMVRELLRAGRKDRALLTLRRKKYQETLIANANAQMLNLEQMVHSIESAAMTNQVLTALGEGKNALTAIHAEASIDDVERLMDETQEAVAYQNELNALLNGELSQEDDAAILKELAALSTEEEEKKTKTETKSSSSNSSSSSIVAQMPAVPTHDVKKNEEAKIAAQLPDVPAHAVTAQPKTDAAAAAAAESKAAAAVILT